MIFLPALSSEDVELQAPTIKQAAITPAARHPDLPIPCPRNL
jgi:hypothetical protein